MLCIEADSGTLGVVKFAKGIAVWGTPEPPKYHGNRHVFLRGSMGDSFIHWESLHSVTFVHFLRFVQGNWEGTNHLFCWEIGTGKTGLLGKKDKPFVLLGKKL